MCGYQKRTGALTCGTCHRSNTQQAGIDQISNKNLNHCYLSIMPGSRGKIRLRNIFSVHKFHYTADPIRCSKPQKKLIQDKEIGYPFYDTFLLTEQTRLNKFRYQTKTRGQRIALLFNTSIIVTFNTLNQNLPIELRQICLSLMKNGKSCLFHRSADLSGTA